MLSLTPLKYLRTPRFVVREGRNGALRSLCIGREVCDILSQDAKEGISSAEGSGGEVFLITQTVIPSLFRLPEQKTYY